MDEELAEILKNFLEEYIELDSSDTGDTPCEYLELSGVEIRTFTECHLLTSNAGLVLNFPDGTQYQLTIVCSR